MPSSYSGTHYTSRTDLPLQDGSGDEYCNRMVSEHTVTNLTVSSFINVEHHKTSGTTLVHCGFNQFLVQHSDLGEKLSNATTNCQTILWEKEEQQMLKQSIFAILTRFLSSHISYIIDHYECPSYFMPLYSEITAQVPAFP